MLKSIFARVTRVKIYRCLLHFYLLSVNSFGSTRIILQIKTPMCDGDGAAGLGLTSRGVLGVNRCQQRSGATSWDDGVQDSGSVKGGCLHQNCLVLKCNQSWWTMLPRCPTLNVKIPTLLPLPACCCCINNFLFFPSGLFHIISFCCVKETESLHWLGNSVLFKDRCFSFDCCLHRTLRRSWIAEIYILKSCSSIFAAPREKAFSRGQRNAQDSITNLHPLSWEETRKELLPL